MSLRAVTHPALLGLALAALLAAGGTPAAQPAQPTFSVDVVADCNRYIEASSQPAMGAYFIQEGVIYRAGTLAARCPGGNGCGLNPDGTPQFPEAVIGKWRCWGSFVGSTGAAAAGGPPSTRPRSTSSRRRLRRRRTRAGRACAGQPRPRVGRSRGAVRARDRRRLRPLQRRRRRGRPDHDRLQPDPVRELHLRLQAAHPDPLLALSGGARSGLPAGRRHTSARDGRRRSGDRPPASDRHRRGALVRRLPWHLAGCGNKVVGGAIFFLERGEGGLGKARAAVWPGCGTLGAAAGHDQPAASSLGSRIRL